MTCHIASPLSCETSRTDACSSVNCCSSVLRSACFSIRSFRAAASAGASSTAGTISRASNESGDRLASARILSAVCRWLRSPSRSASSSKKRETVGSVVEFARAAPGVDEVIVVDDGSIDGTPALACKAGAAVLTSTLTARTRTQAVISQRQARTTAELYAFSKKLAGIAKLDDLLWATAHQIATMLKVEVVILRP